MQHASPNCLQHSLWSAARGCGALCLAMALVALGSVAEAQSQGLQGYWRGGGYISPAKGHRERVRCRVWISRISDRSYGVKARCASQSADIDQTGRVERRGRNSYTGTFHNSDYNIRGRIRISLRGNRQSVTLHSEAGSGRLTLFRR
jgi:hypothetical protein